MQPAPVPESFVIGRPVSLQSGAVSQPRFEAEWPLTDLRKAAKLPFRDLDGWLAFVVLRVHPEIGEEGIRDRGTITLTATDTSGRTHVLKHKAGEPWPVGTVVLDAGFKRDKEKIDRMVGRKPV
jgi:hypothetical protein